MLWKTSLIKWRDNYWLDWEKVHRAYISEGIYVSHSVVSCSLQPHGLQHARPPYPSPTPKVYSNSSPLSWWCHPTVSSSVILLLPSIFSSIRVFSNESVLCIRWPNYWSFSFSISPTLLAQFVENLPAMQETWVRFLGWEDPLEKEMAAHSNVLAWRIPWTEEPSESQNMGS